MVKPVVYLDFIHCNKDRSILIEGYIGGDVDKPQDVSMYIDNRKIRMSYVDRIQAQDGLEYHKPIKGGTFEASFEVNELNTMHLKAFYKGKHIRICPNRFTGLANLLMSYKILAGFVVISYGGNIYTAPRSKISTLFLETILMLSILFNWRIPDIYNRVITSSTTKQRLSWLAKSPAIVCESIITIPRAILLRLMYRMVRPRLKQPIWIISDRAMAAGDNGEYMYRYILKQPTPPATIYFAISSKSRDYSRLRELRGVIDRDSLKYKLLFLLADKVLSSQADIDVINPFGRQINHYVDLFNFEFVFLQHGIIRHDLSSWLNRFNRNIKLFITSSVNEHKSIVEGKYYYSSSQVVLTGLPRFDCLYNKPKNKIILAPTYRKGLLHRKSNSRGERGYDSTFKNSAYFLFYNQFMNDTRIIKALKDFNMTGEFYLHPVFRAQIRDFHGSDSFKIIEYPYDYNKAFSEGNLLISDYSSVIFDFAYLHKPILYSQFDKHDFYAEQGYKRTGLYDDNENGFGDICLDYETLVEKTINIINNGCKMEGVYLGRVESYFAFNDNHNCERVYNAILELNHQEITAQ